MLPIADLVTFEQAVTTATGWLGLFVIAVYSFLIALVLPLPSEVVLLAPLDLGLGYGAELALVIVVSGLGKAAGSLVALRVGREAVESSAVDRLCRRFGVRGPERLTARLVRRWGYVGLALALALPGFPDTLSVYAFSVLDEDYPRFALASFVGSVGRLVVVVVVVGVVTLA